MRILINCYQYEQFETGTDRMAFHTLLELQKIDTINSYTLVCSDHSYIRGAITAPNFRVVRPWRVPFKQADLGRVIRKLWREWQYLRASLYKYDVFYSIHNMQLPKRRVAHKMMLNNLDLILVALPEYHNIGRHTYQQNMKMYRHNIERADAIVSISEFSKKELVQLFDCPEQKVTAVPLAAQKKVAQKKTEINNTPIPATFIFVIGGSEKRKNVITVMKAHALLPTPLRRSFPLLIGGGKWRDQELPQQDYCHWLGYLDENDLTSLYNQATLFISPTTYEGFGLPILEACVQETAVLSARGTSLDEITREIIPTFEATDHHTLAKLLVKYLKNPAQTEALAKDCYNLSKQFSWQKTAKKLHKVLTA